MKSIEEQQFADQYGIFIINIIQKTSIPVDKNNLFAIIFIREMCLAPNEIPIKKASSGTCQSLKQSSLGDIFPTKRCECYSGAKHPYKISATGKATGEN